MSDGRSVLVVARGVQARVLAEQSTVDCCEVLSALESARVGSRAAAGVVDLLVDAVLTRFGPAA